MFSFEMKDFSFEIVDFHHFPFEILNLHTFSFETIDFKGSGCSGGFRGVPGEAGFLWFFAFFTPPQKDQNKG